MKEQYLYLLILLAGIFCLIASFKDWDFFFENRKSKLIIKLLGRSKARVFYGVLGSLVIISSIFLLVQ